MGGGIGDGGKGSGVGGGTGVGGMGLGVGVCAVTSPTTMGWNADRGKPTSRPAMTKMKCR